MSHTIIIAEDDQLIGQAYQMGLQAAGYAVVWAKDGEEVLQKILESKPDLVLLDLRMPKKDGFAVLEEMNTNGLIKTVPVIVTSNMDQKTDIERCQKLGVKDYLVKANSSLDEVVAAIAKQIG